jgi:hypothetical protein
VLRLVEVEMLRLIDEKARTNCQHFIPAQSDRYKPHQISCPTGNYVKKCVSRDAFFVSFLQEMTVKITRRNPKSETH